MRRADWWWTLIAAVGLGLAPLGCGGGSDDEAEFSDDPEVASAEAEPRGEDSAAAEGGEEGAAPGPPMPGAAAPAGDAGLRQAQGQPSAPTPAEGSAAGTATTESSGGGSATDDLLAQARAAAPEAPPTANPAEGATEGAPDAAQANLPGGQAGYPGGPAGYPGSSGSGGLPAGYPGSSGSGGGAYPGYAGAGVRGGRGRASIEAPEMPPGGAQQPDGYPGASAPDGVAEGAAPGAPGASGPGGSDAEPADYRTPVGAAQAFLTALRLRSPERLADAMALRSINEARERHKDDFKKILDQSYPQDALEELGKSFDGYQVAYRGQIQSTGRFPVVLSKEDRGLRYERTLTIRKEKGVWKVLDYSDPRDMKTLYSPRRR